MRIPRENLLNRFGDVSRSGEYTRYIFYSISGARRNHFPELSSFGSDLPTATKRFAATLGELVGGRVGLASGSVAVLKIATTIAVRYSLMRQQFGPPNGPEVSILDYQSQQMKLMPMLASCYAFFFAKDHLIKRYVEMKRTHDEATIADVHVLSAGLKAYITSYTQKALSVCRSLFLLFSPIECLFSLKY